MRTTRRGLDDFPNEKRLIELIGQTHPLRFSKACSILLDKSNKRDPRHVNTNVGMSGLGWGDGSTWCAKATYTHLQCRTHGLILSCDCGPTTLKHFASPRAHPGWNNKQIRSMKKLVLPFYKQHTHVRSSEVDLTLANDKTKNKTNATMASHVESMANDNDKLRLDFGESLLHLPRHPSCYSLATCRISMHMPRTPLLGPRHQGWPGGPLPEAWQGRSAQDLVNGKPYTHTNASR